MTRTIKEGDNVTVYWVDGAELKGIVRHIPTEPGDLWYIENEDGAQQAINPAASNFDSIIKIKKDGDHERNS